MKRLFVLALLGLAGWQAWVHYPKLLQRPLSHEVVVENQGDVAVERVRVKVGDRTLVREVIGPGGSASFRFPLDPGAAVGLVWQRADRTLESSWSGGATDAAPRRYTLRIGADDRVTLESGER